jgi:hypothetical protein
LLKSHFFILIRLVVGLVAAGISFGVGAYLVSPGAGLIAAAAAVAVLNLTVLTPKLLNEIKDAWFRNGT